MWGFSVQILQDSSEKSTCFEIFGAEEFWNFGILEFWNFLFRAFCGLSLLDIAFVVFFLSRFLGFFLFFVIGLFLIDSWFLTFYFLFLPCHYLILLKILLLSSLSKVGYKE